MVGDGKGTDTVAWSPTVVDTTVTTPSDAPGWLPT